MDLEPAELAFAVAAALHLGFQATVTLLLYPALADTAATSDASTWARVHAAHSRRIAPVVGVLYGALLVTGASVLLRASSAWAVVGAAGAVVALGTTAVAAAPLHGRLTAPDGRADPAAVHRLLQVDRMRTVGAVVAATGGLGACLTAM